MRLLLDTSAFLWWIIASDRLSVTAENLIADENNQVWFSTVSSWEIVIKAALKRLILADRPERFIPRQLALNAFQVLPISLQHTLRLSRLPSIHRDPFDRLLIAQAQVENLTIISGDSHLKRYRVPIAW